MSDINQILQQNQDWAAQVKQDNPRFFADLSGQQSPEYLWIGCSDSRVPANQITGMAPGEVFVHRNIANLVVANDLNCLSVIEFAVSALKVKHIIVCGHYGCGGVAATLAGNDLGILNGWLDNLAAIMSDHADELAGLDDPVAKQNRLGELNVITQVEHVSQTDTVQRAWQQGQELSIHGLIYSVNDGILHNLGVTQKPD